MPELILLEDFGGDFHQYLEAVYAIFKHDFIDTKPRWKNKRFAMKRLPLVEGRECTFYHITHETQSDHNEENRIPDLRRMERIAFPRFMIDNIKHPVLKIWRNTRHTNKGLQENVLILNVEEKYVVVLRDNGEYFMLWTAYLCENHTIRKMLKEYNEFIKKQGSQG